MKYIENTWNHAWNIISLYKRCLPLFFSISSHYNENLTTARNPLSLNYFIPFFIKHLPCTNPRQWVLKWIKYAFYFSELIFYQRTCKLITISNMMETLICHIKMLKETQLETWVKVQRSSILVRVRAHSGLETHDWSPEQTWNTRT